MQAARGSQAARGLRAPPAGSARLAGSPIPRPRQRRPRAAWLRPAPKRCSRRWRRRRGPVRAAPAGRDGAAVTGCGQWQAAGLGRSAQPSRSASWLGRWPEGARRAPAGVTRPTGPGAVQPAEAGVRRAVGERSGCTSVTHRARLRLQRRRLGGSAAAGASERAEPRAACTSAGACAIGERETHALTQQHTRERRAGRAGREASRSPPPTFPRLGARVGDGRTPLCLFPLTRSSASPKPGHQLSNTAH